MSPFARDLMENSKRDDCIIVGSDVRALCQEILKLEQERDDPLEQARRELPVFSALRARVAELKALRETALDGLTECADKCNALTTENNRLRKQFEEASRLSHHYRNERDAARAEVAADQETSRKFHINLHDASAEVASLKRLLREALECEGAEGFNAGFTDRCRAAGVEVE